ncbi:MAG: TatD family hydrolase [Armatimonadota bacterium]
MFDSHAHISDTAFQVDRPQVLERARAAGVRGLVNVGCDVDSWDLTTAMVDRKTGLYAAVGVHPHKAATVGRETLDQLRALARGEGVVAIGETGLDLYRNLSPKEQQVEAFRRHIELAAELELALLVHDREAHEEVLDVLGQDAPKDLRVVLHCFSGDLDVLAVAHERGYWVGIAGNVTYPGSHTLVQVTAAVQADRLLIETDCPYLAPQKYRKRRRNEPAYLAETLAVVARARGEDPAEVDAQTEHNAREAFGLLVEGDV